MLFVLGTFPVMYLVKDGYRKENAMKTLMIKLSLSVLPLIALVLTAASWNIHTRKSRARAKGHRVRKGMLKGLSAGIMMR
jgi:hypothetical protein